MILWNIILTLVVVLQFFKLQSLDNYVKLKDEVDLESEL